MQLVKTGQIIRAGVRYALIEDDMLKMRRAKKTFIVPGGMQAYCNKIDLLPEDFSDFARWFAKSECKIVYWTGDEVPIDVLLEDYMETR